MGVGAVPGQRPHRLGTDCQGPGADQDPTKREKTEYREDIYI